MEIKTDPHLRRPALIGEAFQPDQAQHPPPLAKIDPKILSTLQAHLTDSSAHQAITEKDLSFFRDLVNECVEKLDVFHEKKLIPQMCGQHYSSLGRNADGTVRRGFYDHSRTQHMQDTAEYALQFSLLGGFNFRQTLVCTLTALFHDIGHTAFAHSGEAVIWAGGFRKFHHDPNTVVRASQPEVKDFLVDLVGKEIYRDFIACLAGPPYLADLEKIKEMQRELKAFGLSHEIAVSFEEAKEGIENRALVNAWGEYHRLVQDLIDIIAYEIRDHMHTELSDDKKAKVEENAREFFKSMRMNSDGRLSLTNPEAGRKLFAGLANKYQFRACSPISALVNRFIFRAMRRAEIPVQQIIPACDPAVVLQLSQADRDILLTGVDRHYSIECALLPKRRLGNPLYLSDQVLTPKVIDEIVSAIQTEIEAAQANGKLATTREILACNTPYLAKSFEFVLEGEAIEDARKEIAARGANILQHLNKPKHRDTDFFALTSELRQLSGEHGPVYQLSYRLQAQQYLVLAIKNPESGQTDLPNNEIMAKVREIAQKVINDRGLADYFEFDSVPEDGFIQEDL